MRRVTIIRVYRPLPKLTDADIMRLWSKVDIRKNNECWPWTGACTGKTGESYGRFFKGSAAYPAHRVIASLSTVVTPLTVVMHKCDNPVCCNPQHLIVGGQVENLQDCKDKGRARGGRRKLTMSDARFIRSQVDCMSQKTLADKFGVS
jgi:hypothetical protein